MTTSNKEKKANKHVGYWKDGRYRLFTDIYGVFNGTSRRHNERGRLVSRHSSLDEANKAAQKLFDEYDKTGKHTTSHEINGLYYGAIICDYPFSINKISVDELSLDNLTVNELQELRIKYDIKNKTEKSEFELDKNDLFKMIAPTLQHKMHENRRKEKELLQCLLCQEIYKEEYTKLMAEREKDPEIIRQRLQSKMYRKNILNPITEKQLKKKYGSILTEKYISDGVTKQKLHWRTKECFGSVYRIYEKDEIERYYHEIKRNQENDKKVKKTRKKRKYKEVDDADECKSEEPVSKKIKMSK